MIGTLIITIITLIVLTLSILLFPKFKIKHIEIGTYWIIPLIGAILLIICQLIPFKEIWNKLTESSEINPLKILVLFFSMTMLSIFLDEVGLFRYMAKKAVVIAKSSQVSLLIILYLLTAVLTVFTSNDIVILTLTPFICFFCKNTKINPIPFLVSEFAAANTYSMMLIIGNPTNIYLASSANIDFLSYFKVMALPTLAAGIVEFVLILLIFHRSLKKPLEATEDNFELKNKIDLIVGLVHLLTCLVLLVISSYINLEMWLISAICAGSLLIYIIIRSIVLKDNTHYIHNTIRRLPWQLIPFVLSMFVIVIAINYQGISAKIGNLLGTNGVVWTYGLSSFVAANVINNIPMSMLYSTIPLGLDNINYMRAIYATIVGSNIGAFLTPIGALAGIMFTSLTSVYDVKYGFKEFIMYGFIISIPTILTTLGLIAIIV